MRTKELDIRLDVLGLRAGQENFNGSVSEWCECNIRFNEPKRVGEFSFYGREYLREPLDCYGDNGITDLILCFGTRTGKTTVMFAGAAFRAYQRARRALFVHPASKGAAGAESIARTRFIPMIRASPCMAERIPLDRHTFKTAQQMFRNGSIIDWTGSNSVAQVASNSMEDVQQDEIDKFNATRKRDSGGNEVEANSVDLADERTAEFEFPKRVKSSTPTLESGRIWVELMKTDLQRRFIPCPLCGRDHPSSRGVVLAWSKQYTVLPLRYSDARELPIAFVQWDKEAKRPDGTWDYERVKKSAGYVCPHCAGRFLTSDHAGDMVWMDKNGWWESTQRGAPNTAGFHLPSMYANHVSARPGELAVTFLKAHKSLEGDRNVINSRFAEPYTCQDLSSNRREIIRESVIEVGVEWHKLLTADAQQKQPHFWFVVRAWNGKTTEGIACGHTDTFDELRAIQIANGVKDTCVIVDSGYGSKSDAEVYQNCARFGLTQPSGQRFLHFGWMPSKGMPKNKFWYDRKRKQHFPYFLKDIDPFMGTTDAGKVFTSLFEFSAGYYEDKLEDMRNPERAQRTGFVWAVSPQMDKFVADNASTYWQHMDGHIRVRDRNKMGFYSEQWAKRTDKWPDHLLDCEILQVAGAHYAEWFTIEQPTTEEKKAA